MFAYAVIDSPEQLGQHPFGDVHDLHVNYRTAEQELLDILADEPGWRRSSHCWRSS